MFNLKNEKRRISGTSSTPSRSDQQINVESISPKLNVHSSNSPNDDSINNAEPTRIVDKAMSTPTVLVKRMSVELRQVKLKRTKTVECEEYENVDDAFEKNLNERNEILSKLNKMIESSTGENKENNVVPQVPSFRPPIPPLVSPKPNLSNTQINELLRANKTRSELNNYCNLELNFCYSVFITNYFGFKLFVLANF